MPRILRGRERWGKILKVTLVRRAIRKIRRVAKKTIRLRFARRAGLVYVEPNFLYSPRLSANSVVIDAGCSYEADFSVYMMEQHGARAYGVDPTRKHRAALQALENRYRGRFVHLPFAITADDGTLTFHESTTNESGSVLVDHVNVRNDETIPYPVTAISLKSLMKHVDADAVDMLKLDLEGAEYELLATVEKADLAPFRQVFIEFHHHAIGQFNEADTRRLVERIRGFGFSCFSLDDHNYLFQQIGAAHPGAAILPST
jgi:FkbM family methyltransferase